MLSISEFSFMCRLSPQTLRFYHSERLLVPAHVDERTGYRSYTAEQVERAMLITVLRAKGMSVELVRRAVDEPEAAHALLQQHVTGLRRQRQAQDEAIGDARAFLTSWPEVREVHAPATTVVSMPVPDVSADHDTYDWAAADAAYAATLRDLIGIVESSGAVVSGTPWRSWASGTPQQIDRSESRDGPLWLVSLPVTTNEEAMVALPAGVKVHTVEARHELSIFVPGRSSMAKFGTALARLVAHPLENAVIDISRMRQILHADGVETTMPIDGPDPDDLEEKFPNLTHRARTVLGLAIGHAGVVPAHHVETGHLLTCLMDEGANLALTMLHAIGMDPARIRRELTQCAGTEARGSDQETSPQFSAAATRALEFAASEARSQGYDYVGCEHLLLGLLRETDGTAGQVLRALGAAAGPARRALAAALARHVE